MKLKSSIVSLSFLPDKSALSTRLPNRNEFSSSSGCFSLCVFPLDNLWGDYGPAGTYLERKSQPSVQVQEASSHMDKPYVFNDIATYFTLLVGIYFPSVTGRSNAKQSWESIDWKWWSWWCHTGRSKKYQIRIRTNLTNPFIVPLFGFRYNGWFQQVWGSQRCSEVHPNRNHHGNSHHLLPMYPRHLERRLNKPPHACDRGLSRDDRKQQFRQILF